MAHKSKPQNFVHIIGKCLLIFKIFSPSNFVENL